MEQGLKLSGRAKLVLKGPDGATKAMVFARNRVTDAGLAWIASRMGANAGVLMSHGALGSGTAVPAAGDAALGAQLGARAALGAPGTATGASIAYRAEFGPGAGTGAVTESGLFNAATGGVMLARLVFNVIHKEAADTLAMDWTITLAAA